MTEPRYCTNCRAELPEKTATCPACGVYAGDVFDGRMPNRHRTRFAFWLPVLAIVAALAAGAWWLARTPDAQLPWTPKPAPAPAPPPVRVVGDRPGGARRAKGAAVNEAEAIRLLRRHLVETRGIRNECLAVLSHGVQQGSYTLTAVNSCDDVRLGRFRVDGKSGAVSP